MFQTTNQLCVVSNAIFSEPLKRTHRALVDQTQLAHLRDPVQVKSTKAAAFLFFATAISLNQLLGHSNFFEPKQVAISLGFASCFVAKNRFTYNIYIYICIIHTKTPKQMDP